MTTATEAPGTYSVMVPSQSDPTKSYRVTFTNTSAWCNCPGYLAHQHCKHSEAVRRLNMETNTGLMIPSANGAVEAMEARLGTIKTRQKLIEQFFKDVMVKDEDYGVIPGTAKPSLWKPGAEKLCEFYGYAPVVKEARESINEATGFYRVVVTIALVERGSGQIVGEGVGEANTMEEKHRWRQAKRSCPSCGAKAIIKGKDEYGGGWVCFKKQDGCGAKFKDNDATITSQAAGRVENDDPWTLWNTILKMAKKRALVDATLSATRSSGLFTQDTEDLEKWIATSEGIEVSQPARPAADAAPRAPARRKGDGWNGLTTAQQLRAKITELASDRRGVVVKAILTESPHADDGSGKIVINKLSPKEQLSALDIVRRELGEAVGELPFDDTLAAE